MKVSELRELLASWPDDDLVVLSEDRAGSAFKILACIEPGMWHSVWQEAWDRADDGAVDGGESFVPCVVLWPEYE